MTLLKIFTMNVYGIPVLAKKKNERMEALAQALKSGDYDVVCLQEIWNTDDFYMIHSIIEKVMPFKHYFHSGLFGSGLGTFSKWPIVETIFHKFPLNGYVHKIHHADWVAGKGIGLAKIEVNGKIVHVFNAHLHAKYCEEDDEYLAHRLSQAYEAAQLVNLGLENAALTLFVGDLNSKPSDICTRMIHLMPGLQDAFLHFDNEWKYATNETPRNSFTPPLVLQSNPTGNRLDYILYKSNSLHESTPLSYDFALPERIPGHDVSYSDHEAITVTIELKENSTNSKPDCKALGEILQESINITKRSIDQVIHDRDTLMRLLLLLSVTLISSYTLSYVFSPVLAFFEILNAFPSHKQYWWYKVILLVSLMIMSFISYFYFISLYPLINISLVSSSFFAILAVSPPHKGHCRYKITSIVLALYLMVIDRSFMSLHLNTAASIFIYSVNMLSWFWVTQYQIEVQSLRGVCYSLEVLKISNT